MATVLHHHIQHMRNGKKVRSGKLLNEIHLFIYHRRALRPHKKIKSPMFKRAHRRNHERSCVLLIFFKILLEYQFFPEMLKQVRGSVNEYMCKDTRLNKVHFFFPVGAEGGGGGNISRYSTGTCMLFIHFTSRYGFEK